MADRIKDLSKLGSLIDKSKLAPNKPESDLNISKGKKTEFKGDTPKDKKAGAEVTASSQTKVKQTVAQDLKQDNNNVLIPPKNVSGEKGSYTILAEKPYNFVPVAEKVERKKAAEQDKYNPNLLSGKLVVKITAKTPLHIGTGRYINKNNQLQIEFIKKSGKPVIPGSSLKGAVRSILETVSKSCVLVTGGIAKELVEKALPGSNNFKCKAYTEACPACRILGLAGKESAKSLVEFSDLFPTSPVSTLTLKVPMQEAPFKDYPGNFKDGRTLQGSGYVTDLKRILRINDSRFRGYGNERLYYCRLCSDHSKCYTCKKQEFWDRYNAYENKLTRPLKFRGRKFYYHARKQVQAAGSGYEYREFVPEGTEFTGEIFFKNLTVDEYGLLLYSMGISREFNPKLGYGKPLFYGSIEIELVEVKPYRYSAKIIDALEAIKTYKENTKDLENQRKHLETYLSYQNPLGQERPEVLY